MNVRMVKGGFPLRPAGLQSLIGSQSEVVNRSKGARQPGIKDKGMVNVRTASKVGTKARALKQHKHNGELFSND